MNEHTDNKHSEQKKDSGEQYESDAAPTSIKDMALSFVSIISAKGWQYLGLMAHPENGKIHENLPEARKAIDLCSLVFNALKVELQKDEIQEIEGMISNLQLNYVKRQNREEEGKAEDTHTQ